MAKVYGLYCPYHKSEIMDSTEPGYENLPPYPKEFRRVRRYDDKGKQLFGFTNVMCPASQMFECEEEDLEKVVADLDAKFADDEWRTKNIDPYI